MACYILCKGREGRHRRNLVIDQFATIKDTAMSVARCDECERHYPEYFVIVVRHRVNGFLTAATAP
jgi:hypothetical protein